MVQAHLDGLSTGEDLAYLNEHRDAWVESLWRLLDELARIGVDIDEVTAQLETEGVASFEKSFDELLDALNAKVDSIN